MNNENSIEAISMPDGLNNLVKGYMEYAMETIRDRAIPNIDGLKPSQRRILVTMKELEKVKGWTKCQTVCGTCMKLHPHGDCLKGDTKLLGADGKFYTMEEIYNAEKKLDIIAYDTSTKQPVITTAHSFRIGQYTDKIYNIKLSNGETVRVTSNHPFLVKKEDEEVWVKAENLAVTDKLVSAVIDMNIEMVRHHRDHNVNNNSLANIVCLTRDEHAKKHLSSKNNVYVTEITVTETKSEPMYDFTVDVYENMFIPVGTDANNVTMVCVHNSAIYDTLCRMTDVSETLNVPLIKGKGKFEKVYSEDPSAAARYTECDFMPIIDEYFADAIGVPRIPNFDNARDEPEVLGVSFPSVLCNPSEGIAIGLASNIPAFNFHDVIKATINVIKTGRMGELIAPDFTTCGEYVYNETELKKIAKRGKGSIKLRGKWRIEGKVIIIDEIPYYTTIQKIKNDAEKIAGVVRCKDLTGLRDGKTVMRLDVECSNKNVVDHVLNSLLKETDLQMQVSANIVVIIDGEPRFVGIEELLREWVKFRTKVLSKKYALALESYKFEIARYEVLVKLLTDKTLRDEFINALTKGEIMARGVLNKAFPDVDSKTLDWILDMKIRSFASADKATSKLAGFKEALKDTEYKIQHIAEVIVKQLEEINAKYSYPRRTEISNRDYTFEVVKPTPYKVIVTVKDKFISKTAYTPAIANIIKGIECMSDDIISIIDTKGRLLRVPLETIPQTSTGTKGIYIPSYCGVPDDFDVVDYDLVENVTYGYVYADGFASFLNLSEWVGVQRKTRCTPNGMPESTALIRGKFNPDVQVLYVLTNKNRFAFIRNDFKQKSRTARTRIINVGNNEEIIFVKAMTYADALLVCPSAVSDSMGKLKTLTNEEDFNVEHFNSI